MDEQDQDRLRGAAYDQLQDDLHAASERYVTALQAEDDAKVVVTLAASVMMYAATIGRISGISREVLDRILKGVVDEAYEDPRITQLGGDA
jgi:hypothetical protein